MTTAAPTLRMTDREKERYERALLRVQTEAALEACRKALLPDVRRPIRSMARMATA